MSAAWLGFPDCFLHLDCCTISLWCHTELLKRRQRLERCIYKPRHPLGCWEPLEARKGQKGMLPYILKREHDLANTWISDFEPPCLWQNNSLVLKLPVCGNYWQPSETKIYTHLPKYIDVTTLSHFFPDAFISSPYKCLFFCASYLCLISFYLSIPSPLFKRG